MSGEFDLDKDILVVEEKLKQLYLSITEKLEDYDVMQIQDNLLLRGLRTDVTNIEHKILELAFNLREEKKALESQIRRLGEEPVKVKKIK